MRHKTGVFVWAIVRGTNDVGDFPLSRSDKMSHGIRPALHLLVDPRALRTTLNTKESEKTELFFGVAWL